MKTIYLDRAQCSHFGFLYEGGDKVFVAADTLLKSKGGDGYDKEIVVWMKPLGGKTLILEPTGCGWYNVPGYVCGRGVYEDFEGVRKSFF